MAVLEVEDLKIAFGDNHIIRGVSFELEAGHTLGVVGESGCGKSMTGFSIMNMLPGIGKITSGSIRLDGKELTTLPSKDWLDIRGKQIALVMQDPFTSLNPMMKIGHQIGEVLQIHQNLSKDQAWKQAVELLDKVGVPAPESSANKYPHQMSGGQRQRVVIAIAFACKPKVLIADEPTTALDVTLQAQILRLLKELKETEGTAVMLISHDIGVIGAMASKIAVFYAGRIVEHGRAEDVLFQPQHPYTQALLASLPRAGQTTLESISGQPPDLTKPIIECAFRPRCKFAHDRCMVEPGLLAHTEIHRAACWQLESLQTTTNS